MLKAARALAFLLTLFAALPASRAQGAGPYILVDVASGAVLAEDRGNALWYPASLTKLMTAYLTFRALGDGRLTATSPVVVSANALAEPPSKMGFAVGTVITVDNALKMLLVRSANDIAVALGEAVSGSESGFVAAMNAEAGRLGMSNTRFVNPNGLPGRGQYTTARDLAVLSRAIYRDYPQYHPLFGIPAIRHGRQVMRSQNALLERFAGADGMKTGFICASGFNMVASATRNGRTLIAVVLGERSSLARAESAAGLLDRGFNGWSLAALRRNLDAPVAAAVDAAPPDLRPIVCGRGAAQTEDGDAAGAVTAAPSLLGPRIAMAEPVVVFTGGADRGRAVIATGIPLPRPKPPLTAVSQAATAGAVAGPFSAFAAAPVLIAPVADGPLNLMPVPRPRP